LFPLLLLPLSRACFCPHKFHEDELWKQGLGISNSV
jgi:hypothetical protein